MIASTLRERNSIPRLIELLSTLAKDDAAEAISKITFQPAKELSAAKSAGLVGYQLSRPVTDVLLQQLHSADPEVQVEAATALCEARSKEIFPVAV